MPRTSTRRTAATALFVGAMVAAAMPVATSAASTTLYVDGKTGNDSNGGHATRDAFKTIARAAAKLPAGSSAAGWTVSVKGYTDYVYRERPIPPGWDRRGTSGHPITFQATGYVAGASSGYVKPIVSGADVVPKTSWKASSTSGVYYAPFATTPFLFGNY